MLISFAGTIQIIIVKLDKYFEDNNNDPLKDKVYDIIQLIFGNVNCRIGALFMLNGIVNC